MSSHQATSWSAHEGAWLLAGSREVFPADVPDAPAHKYAALFHPHPAFDALRFAFMVQADAHMTPAAFTDRLLDATADADAAHLTDTFIADLTQLSDAVREFTCIGSSNFPMDFADRAWPAYLEAIMDPEYYFSTEELLVMAHVAGVSLVVLQSRAGEYHIGGGSRRDDGELVVVKIEDNGRERVRGHFERCFRTAELQELDTRLSQSTMSSGNCAPATVDAPGSDKRREELDRGSQSLSRSTGEKQQAPASVDAPDSDKRREEMDRGNRSESLSRGSGEKQQDARR